MSKERLGRLTGLSATASVRVAVVPRVVARVLSAGLAGTLAGTVAGGFALLAAPLPSAPELGARAAETTADRAATEQAAIVASAQEEELSCAEATRFLPRLAPELRRQRAGEGDADWRERIVTEMLIDRELARRAIASGLDDRPEFIATWTARRKSVLTSELERSFGDSSAATDAEIEAYYAAHRERFRLDERIASRFILLKLSAEPTAGELAEATSRLEEIREQFLAAGGFGELARQHSEAENAGRGGVVATSTRGSLLAEYEEVAWRLAPGEVSHPVRLPVGLAIIWLEQRFPAKESSLAEARPRAVKLLAEQARQQRRIEALREARSAWPMAIDWDPKRREPKISLAGKEVTLEALGLGHRPPRLSEEIQRAIDQNWLLLLAERRALAERADIAQRLSDLRQTLLARAALEDRAARLVPELDDNGLREVYRQKSSSLRRPELRTFEALRLAGAEGSMRQAREAAVEAASTWRLSSSPPTHLDPRTARIETWGPLSRAVLGNKVSPLVAKAAFELDLGEISEPIRFERYLAQGGRFLPEGYVVLHLVEAAPPTVPTLDEAREDLRWIAARPELPALRATVREQIGTDLAVKVSSASLAACATLRPPATRAERKPTR